MSGGGAMTVAAVNIGTARAKSFSGTSAQTAARTGHLQTRHTVPLSEPCRLCHSNEDCISSYLSGSVDHPSSLVESSTHTLGKREHLFHQSDKLEALYIIKSGSAKLYFLSENGNEQVVAFYMPGDILGLDALGSNVHQTSAVVLERTTCCVIPIASLNQAQGYHHWLFVQLSKELVRDQRALGCILKKDAETKMARFLVGLSQGFHTRGYSATCFNLSMKRSEIASYIGIAVETVSRLLSHFQELGLLRVERRYIHIYNLEELKKRAENRP